MPIEQNARSREPTYSAGDYVALGPTLQIVASDATRQGAKEKAIVEGVPSPLIIAASQLRKSPQR